MISFENFIQKFSKSHSAKQLFEFDPVVKFDVFDEMVFAERHRGFVVNLRSTRDLTMVLAKIAPSLKLILFYLNVLGVLLNWYEQAPWV